MGTNNKCTSENCTRQRGNLLFFTKTNNSNNIQMGRYNACPGFHYEKIFESSVSLRGNDLSSFLVD